MSYRPLGDDSDFPADPVTVASYGGSLAATGALILQQVDLLKALARGDCWVADTADAFREQAQELAERIEKASDRYVTVGDKLKTLADDLADYESKAAERADEAQALQWTIAANPVARPEAPPEGGLPQLTPEGEAQNSRRRVAEERMAVLQTEFDGYVLQAREAASTAAGAVKGAIDDDVKDNWWESNASWLGKARDYLGWAAAAAGIALAIALAVATSPAWLIAGLIVAGIALAAAALFLSINLALEADGSWADVAWDFVGLASFGVGSVATRVASKAFPAVRSAVAGVRASRAHRAVFDTIPPALLTELRRYASVAVDATGDNIAARQLLAEVTRNARAAAAAARGRTFADFPVTWGQRLVDGGLGNSRLTRQAREMLLDLRTMPGAAVDSAVVDRVSRVVRLSRDGILAANAGLAAELGDAFTDPPNLVDDGPVKILTDFVQRLT